MPDICSELRLCERPFPRPDRPGFIGFQYPVPVARPPSGSDWLHEIKFDGRRVQLSVQRGQVKAHVRGGHNWTDRLPELAADLSGWPDCILDGELCALDDQGHPDGARLRAAIGLGHTSGLVVFLFDLLWSDDRDMRPVDLLTRKGTLADLITRQDNRRLRLVGETHGDGEVLLNAVCALGQQGIVSKRCASPYRKGRSAAWRKATCPSGQAIDGS